MLYAYVAHNQKHDIIVYVKEGTRSVEGISICSQQMAFEAMSYYEELPG